VILGFEINEWNHRLYVHANLFFPFYFFIPNPSSRMGRSMLHQPVIGFIFV
jgi:hypothetical protein